MTQESNVKGFPKRYSEIPYQDLLEQTTLKEFLTALDIVNKDTNQKVPNDHVDADQKRQSSFVSI